jgi:methyl-accepting chemotaxis protein
MVYAFMDIRSAIIKHSVSHTTGEKAAAEAMSGEADKKLDDLFNDYEKNLIADDHDRQLMQDDKAKLAAYVLNAASISTCPTAARRIWPMPCCAMAP